VKLLLNKGVNVNTKGGRYGNALQIASLGDYEQTVKLLLDKGADVNAKGRRYNAGCSVRLISTKASVIINTVVRYVECQENFFTVIKSIGWCCGRREQH